MQIKVYGKLPQEASKIRQEVFIDEQGFESEFDETDSAAVHIVAFDDGRALGTCRIFEGENEGDYILGRLAVVKEARGLGVGAFLVEAAEKEAKRLGATTMLLHSQTRASGFYERQGYAGFGEIDYDEYCPHIWMKKKL